MTVHEEMNKTLFSVHTGDSLTGTCIILCVGFGEGRAVFRAGVQSEAGILVFSSFLSMSFL